MNTTPQSHLQNFLVQEFNTLSVVYGQPSSSFIMPSNQFGVPIGNETPPHRNQSTRSHGNKEDDNTSTGWFVYVGKELSKISNWNVSARFFVKKQFDLILYRIFLVFIKLGDVVRQKKEGAVAVGNILVNAYSTKNFPCPCIALFLLSIAPLHVIMEN